MANGGAHEKKSIQVTFWELKIPSLKRNSKSPKWSKKKKKWMDGKGGGIRTRAFLFGPFSGAFCCWFFRGFIGRFVDARDLSNTKTPREGATLCNVTFVFFFKVHDYLVVSNIFSFHPYLGKWSNLTNIFQTGWSHQPDDVIPLLPVELMSSQTTIVSRCAINFEYEWFNPWNHTCIPAFLFSNPILGETWILWAIYCNNSHLFWMFSAENSHQGPLKRWSNTGCPGSGHWCCFWQVGGLWNTMGRFEKPILVHFHWRNWNAIYFLYFQMITFPEATV